jgi:hypothetical protein
MGGGGGGKKLEGIEGIKGRILGILLLRVSDNPNE